MAIIRTGRLSELGSIEVEFDQERGLRMWQTWAGDPDSINGFVNGLRAQGYDVSVRSKPPLAEVRFGRYEQEGMIVRDPKSWDRWTLDVEMVEQDIFAHPSVVAEAESFAKGAGSYKEKITTAAEKQQPLPSELYLPYARKVYRELLRGVTSWEVDNIIVTRTRIFRPYGSEYSHRGVTRTDPALTNLVWRTGIWIVLWDVPSYILFQLPSQEPEDLAIAAYGWRLRTHAVDLQGNGEGEEQLQFSYAAWSLLNYELIETLS